MVFAWCLWEDPITQKYFFCTSHFWKKKRNWNDQEQLKLSKPLNHILCEGTHGKQLVNFQLMLLVKSSRMTGISNNECGTIIVHTSFSTSYEKMSSLTHRTSAMHVWRRNWGRSIGRWSAKRKFIAITSNSVNKRKIQLNIKI